MWKSSLKTGGHHAIFWVLEFKKSKILKTDLHYNIRFNFVFDSFFELDHVLNIYFRSLSEEMT